MSGMIDRLDSFTNPTSSLGEDGFDPTLDAEVKPPRHLNDQELLTLWRDNHYAGIAVDERVESATRKGWRVTTPDKMPPALDVDATDLACDFDDDWSIWLAVRQAHALGDLFGFAAIFPILDDGKHPSEPLDLSRPYKPYKLLNILVVDKRELTPVRWTASMVDRNYRKPEVWSFTPYGQAGGVAGLYIHHSRLIPFGGRFVPPDVVAQNNGAGDSMLRPAWEAIRHKTTIDQSRAVLMNDFKVDVITTPDLDSLTTADEQLEYQENRLRILAKAKSLLNLVLLDGKETYQKTTTSVAGVADLDDRTANELSSAFRMPQTRLNGEAPGGLNTDGESQTKNWNDQIAALQRLRIRPGLVRLYRIAFGASNGPTGGVVPRKFYVEFAALDEPTEQQAANTRFTVAQTDAVYLDRAVISPERVARGRFAEAAWSVDLPPENDVVPLDDVPLDDVPQPDALDVGGKQMPASATVLNGAQIASMVQVAAAVAAGQITEDSAREIIKVAFNVDDDTAARIVGKPSAVIAPQPVPTLPDPAQQPDTPGVNNGE
jgi:phage-related protein (TIGR01555 family)